MSWVFSVGRCDVSGYTDLGGAFKKCFIITPLWGKISILTTVIFFKVETTQLVILYLKHENNSPLNSVKTMPNMNVS